MDSLSSIVAPAIPHGLNFAKPHCLTRSSFGRATDDRSARSAQNQVYLFLFFQREVSKPIVLTETVFQQTDQPPFQ